jgi:hypothetical protein
MVNLVQRDGWDGIFYDNLTDFPTSPLVDVDRDGRADGGVVNGVNVWRAGERALLAETRRLLPGAPLMVNGDLVIRGLADGREMESFPILLNVVRTGTLSTAELLAIILRTGTAREDVVAMAQRLLVQKAVSLASPTPV